MISGPTFEDNAPSHINTAGNRNDEVVEVPVSHVDGNPPPTRWRGGGPIIGVADKSNEGDCPWRDSSQIECAIRFEIVHRRESPGSRHVELKDSSFTYRPPCLGVDNDTRQTPRPDRRNHDVDSTHCSSGAHINPGCTIFVCRSPEIRRQPRFTL